MPCLPRVATKKVCLATFRRNHAAQAFPAQNPVDRTTYMFTYLDADERRPSLAALMELYWRTMPAYQVPSAEQRARLPAA